jgi:hypothetical protein
LQLASVDNYDEISTVQMRREGWVVFPAQYSRDFARQSSNRLAGGINQIPPARGKQVLF